MKISVNSTFSYITFNLNYGSTLQCYALQKVLKDRGHDATLLKDYRANPVHIIKRLKNIRYPKYFLAKAMAQIEMQKFIHSNISLSRKAYFSYSGLVKHCPDAQCHIAGSDQIWRDAKNFRYLTYVPDDRLKLSYAASFGKSHISNHMKEEIKPYLGRLDGISVRERSGVDILRSMGYEAKHVLDPTLLLDSTEYPIKENNKQGYCYCYFLNLSDRSNIPIERIHDFCRINNKALMLTAPLNYPMFMEYKPIFPSVDEWLGLYKNAECIFTNTYHGLLFSIIFKKQFLLFIQQGASKEENERFYSLLEMLKLSDRIVTDSEIDIISEKMQIPIDYEAVYKIIRAQRKETDQFLKKYGI